MYVGGAYNRSITHRNPASPCITFPYPPSFSSCPPSCLVPFARPARVVPVVLATTAPLPTLSRSCVLITFPG